MLDQANINPEPYELEEGEIPPAWMFKAPAVTAKKGKSKKAKKGKKARWIEPKAVAVVEKAVAEKKAGGRKKPAARVRKVKAPAIREPEVPQDAILLGPVDLQVRCCIHCAAGSQSHSLECEAPVARHIAVLLLTNMQVNIKMPCFATDLLLAAVSRHGSGFSLGM